MSSSNTNTMSIRSTLEKNKLVGRNYLDWHRNLRIVLRQEGKSHVLDTELVEPGPDATADEKAAFEKLKKDSNDVTCLMLACMDASLQKKFEDSDAHMINTVLKEMFQEQERIERFSTLKELVNCKMPPGSAVSTHVLKVQALIDHLEKLGEKLSKIMQQDLILCALPPMFSPFVTNYHMHSMNKTIPELHGMLKNFESETLKASGENKARVAGNVLTIQNKDGKRSKSKGSSAKKRSKLNKKGKEKSKDETCYHCHKAGHWKRDCKSYLEEVKKGKTALQAGLSGINVIEVNLSTMNNWVLDTGCGTHICRNMQGLSNSRRLARGEVDLRVGNGAKVAALAVGVYNLTLPSGLILVLNNCYFVPSLCKNIISVSKLAKDGYEFVIRNNEFTICKNSIIYGIP